MGTKNITSASVVDEVSRGRQQFKRTDTGGLQHAVIWSASHAVVAHQLTRIADAVTTQLDAARLMREAAATALDDLRHAMHVAEVARAARATNDEPTDTEDADVKRFARTIKRLTKALNAVSP